MKHIALGSTVRDAVTGFQGVATGRFEYLNGCIRYMVECPPKDEGGKPEELIFDEERLEQVEPPHERWAHVEQRLHGHLTAGVEASPDTDKIPVRTGGPRPTPSRDRSGGTE